jgi:soluble lytic murein transglycosylase-like protein
MVSFLPIFIPRDDAERLGNMSLHPYTDHRKPSFAVARGWSCLVPGLAWAIVLLSFISCIADSAVAGIYRYEDENGVIHFTNCPREAKFKLYMREATDNAPPLIRRTNYGYIKDSTIYDHLIAESAQKHKVEFALVKAVIRAESGFNPYAISRKGARGLMQLMPETASRMSVPNIFDPRDNIDGGVRYLKYLMYLFNNDLRLSLAAYNAGENIVAQLGTIPPYRETVEYVQKVLDFYQQYRQ